MVTVGGGFIFLFIPHPHACFFHQLGSFPATHWKAQRIQYFLNASFAIGVIAELGDIFYPSQHLLMRLVIRFIRLTFLVTVIIVTVYTQ